MFGQYFGRYLVENNKISQAELDKIMMDFENKPVKLGDIAVAEKLLTTKQADDINELQKKMDMRFGDIAIEKGYLLAEEVTYLLNMQGNPYIKFVQAVTDHNILTLEQIEVCLEEYKADNDLSDCDIDALKSGDIDRIIPIFVDTDIPYTGDCIGLAIRNIIRFINSSIVLKKSYKTKEYSFGNLAFQQMVGDQQFFVGFAAKGKELLHIAEPFAKENFTEMDEDAFDSVCEFINCTNGLYASKLSMEDIHIDMTPPFFVINQKLISDGDIYVLPILINGEQVDLLVAVNNPVRIN
ncbi:MAG: hypothetical protein GX306_04180 [Clostridiales bacterium]|jgi:hypothetical protein|nr:hypothetical protein [Clostridiales bacterium]